MFETAFFSYFYGRYNSDKMISQSEMKIFSSRSFIKEFVFYNSFLKISIFILFFSSFVFTTYSQSIFEKGYSTIINYSYKDYNHRPQNHAIIQDNRGVMYFGNSEGILEFDGIYWKKIPVKEKPVRSLAIDKNGRIYVGAMNEFGYLIADSVGELKYHSLIQYLDDKDKDFGYVWKTHVTSEGIYFQTHGAIFRWNKDSLKTWRSENQYHLSFNINGKIFVRERGNGLKIMKEDTLILINNGEKFAAIDVYGMVPVGENDALIISKEEGIFRLYNINDPEKSRLVRYFTEIDNFLSENDVNNVINIDEYKYSFGTWGSGVIIYDQTTGQFEVINKISGLQDEIIQDQFLDNRNNLWLALDNGISMVSISIPVSFYKDKAGLETTIESITRFNNYLYVATRTGTYYLSHPGGLNTPPTFSKHSFYNKPGFLQVDEVTSECWGLLSVEFEKQKFLFIALNNIVYVIDKNNKIVDKLDNIPWDFWQSKQYPRLVFIGVEDGIESYYLRNGKWTKDIKIKGIEERIYKITEDLSGNLWMGTNNSSVYVMNITNYSLTKEDPKVFKYDTLHGLPEGDIYVELVNGKPLFATTKGLYSFLPDQERFEPDTSFGAEFADGSRDIYKLLQDHEKNIWMVTYIPATEEYETGFLRLMKNGNYEWIKEPFLSFSKEVIHALHHDKDGITWMGGPEGLFRFDPGMEKDYEQEYNTLIRKVTLGQDSIIFHGTYYDKNSLPAITQPVTLIPVLPYKYNSLTFEFSAPVNEDNSPMLFSYYLEGYEKDWSDWSIDTKKEYTNLHEGSYKFYIRSQNLYEKIGNEATYEFSITPPWTRTILAYIGYVLFFTAFIYAVVVIYTRNLRAIIRARTAEIREKKEEIEEKNKDIMDSIQYAQRIQEALLTPGDYIDKLFPERFILYMPRDIVSGDYYWMTEKNNKIICVTADCTGHGVPGAFMSMLGMAFLNEIVSKRESIHANEILNELRAMVISSLRQTGQIGESQDGMDIALYILDTENMKLEYAGANNPLFLYRDKELFITKADKMPIGISSRADESFTNHVIDLQKDDIIYTFSDGYPDQFGGPKEKKFMIKNFKQLLSENLHRSMDEQKKILESTLKEWMTNTVQVDDILVIGVKV